MGKALAAKEEHARVEIQRFTIAELEEADYNPRLITQSALDGLTSSVKQFGLLTHPVVNVWEGKKRLVGGHQRLRVLRSEGATSVDCVVVRMDPDDERLANFTLNNPSIQGEFVPHLTRELLTRLRTLAGDTATPLFSKLRFDALVRQVVKSVQREAGVDDVVHQGQIGDDVPVEIPRSAGTSKSGMVYKLGRHLLQCGKLKAAVPLSRIGVESADVAISRLVSKDPFNAEFLDVYLGHVLRNTVGAVFLATAFPNLGQLHHHFVARGGYWSNTLLYAPPNVKGVSGTPYADSCRPVLYGWADGVPHSFLGDRTRSNYWALSQDVPRDDLPVEFVVRALMDTTKVGGVLLDSFADKGATLIAAEKTDRRFVGIARSPRDCDRVKARWSRFVHGKDVDWRDATGDTIDV